MDPDQVPKHRQTVYKSSNPIFSTFKEVLFTKPGSAEGQSSIPTGQQTTSSITSTTVVGQGGTSSSRGQGSSTIATTTSTPGAPLVSESPISAGPYIPYPGGYEVRPEILSQATPAKPSQTSIASSEQPSRSSKEEPIYPSVEEKARQLEHLFEMEKLDTRRQRLCAETESQTFETQNVPKSEFPNEIPMPPPLPGTPASTITSTISSATVNTVQNAKQTAVSGVNTVKETTYHTLETAKEKASSGVNTVKETTIHTLESAKEKAVSGINTAGESLQHAKEKVSHTIETVKESTAAGLNKAKETTSSAVEQAKEKGAYGFEKAKETGAYGFEKAKEVTAPYFQKAVETEQKYMHQAKEKAALYGQQGVELAKDTAVYGVHQTAETIPTIKEYANVAASGAISLAYAAVEIGKETAQLVKEVITEGVHIAKEELQRKPAATSTTATYSTTRQRHAMMSGHVVSGATQPAVVVGEKSTITYNEAAQRLQGITEAALDKMNSLMTNSQIIKSEAAWREAQYNLQQFAQFTVKSLWDFVHGLEIVDFPLKMREIENQAFRSEKMIWDRLSDFEGQSWSGSQVFQSAAPTTSTTNSTSVSQVTVRESTIINSSEGTKRSDVIEKYPVNNPQSVVYHSEA